MHQHRSAPRDPVQVRGAQTPGLPEQVYDFFVALIPEIFDVTLADTDLAKGVLVSPADISARDAAHAAIMMNHGIESIATFDHGFDRIGSIRRIELTGSGTARAPSISQLMLCLRTFRTSATRFEVRHGLALRRPPEFAFG